MSRLHTSSRRRLLLCAALTVTACLVGPLVASGRLATAGSDWAQVGGNAAHTGVSTDVTIGTSQTAAITVSQQFQAPDSRAVLPAISQGVVYIPFGSSSLAGIEAIPAADLTSPSAGTGFTSVVFSSGHPVVDEPVTDVPDHRLWAIDSAGSLVGFDTGCTAASTCPPAAQAHVGTCPTACTASPVVGSGIVVAETSDGNLDAYRANCTGTCLPLWHTTIGAGARSTPTIANGLVYVGSSTGSVLVFATECAHHGETCSPLWHTPAGDTSGNTVAVDGIDGIAFWTSADGNLYGSYGCTAVGIDTPCAARIVTPLGVGAVLATPLIDLADREVIATLPTGVIEAFRLAVCPGAAPCALTRVWSVALPPPLVTASATPSLADGVVWIGDTIGFLHAIAAAGCGAPTCSELPLPVVAGGGYQLAPGAIDGMSTEVAAGAIWVASETFVNSVDPPAYLLTTVVPR